MATKDTYKSIAEPCEGLFKDNGSRFIALAYPVETEAEVKEIVQRLKKANSGLLVYIFPWLSGRVVVDSLSPCQLWS